MQPSTNDFKDSDDAYDDTLGKRKREEETESVKRQATETLLSAFTQDKLLAAGPSAILGTASLRSEIIPIPQRKVAAIIGSKGSVIQEIQTRSQCRLMMDQNFPDGADRQLHLTGDTAQLETAKFLIGKILTEGPQSINAVDGASAITHVMDCPQVCVGKIIGRGGEVIRELQMRSGTKIVIDQNFPEGFPRKVSLTGPLSNIQLAIQLIRQAIEHGPSFLSSLPSTTPSLTSSSSSNATNLIISSRLDGSSLISLSKSYIGKIIGKGGETVNRLSDINQVNIKINQTADPVEIIITSKPGVGGNVPRAVLMIQEIVNNTVNRGPAAYQPSYASAAASPPAMPLPPVVECKTSDGQVYYYDPMTKTSSWVKIR